MTNKKNETDFCRYTPFLPEPSWVPVAKWIRVRLDNKYVASSKRVMLRRNSPLVYYFPKNDVNMDLLENAGQSAETDYWGAPTDWHIEINSKKTENVAWSYEEPADKAPENIRQYIAFKWNAMDTWMEENEEVFVHPRDPYHRIDVCNSSRHVQITVSGETVAETRCAVFLFETGLPVRYYFPKTSVRLDLLQPSSHHTQCPYKGKASYYSVINGGEAMKNLAWTYLFPNAEVLKIKALVAFFTERLDEVFVDGVKLPKMKTKWSL
jgi:uncharacterized protein (DUF427 family)